MLFPIGMDCKTYYLSTGTRATWGTADVDGVHEGVAPANLTEITIVRDVTKSLEKGSVEGGQNRGSTWQLVRGTYKTLQLEVTMSYDTDNAGYLALLNAYLDNSVIALALLDGAKTVTDVMGLWADFEVLSFSTPEELEGEMVVTVQLRPTGNTSVLPEMVRVTAS